MGAGVALRKNMYWKTMGCWARRPKLLSDSKPVSSGTDCFSMRAQVR